ncbi:MAG TPA: aminotransferase class IV [Ohtaekwangia sp.]|nr:aminotransferase class IV [Ohtaekwangia sp.]
MVAFIHGEFIPVENAFVHVSDLAVQRGYGIFDFFKIAKGHPFFLNDYLDRFYHSASVMRLNVPYDRKELARHIFTLIEKNGMPDSGIKMILTGGYSIDGYQPAQSNLILTQHPLVLPGPEQISQGVKIITHDFVRDIPEVKTINYTMGIWLIKRVNDHAAYDVLYHKAGVVSEFPRSNFFIVTQNNVVVTPSINVLRGITRKNILSIASQKFEVKEAVVTLDDILSAREAFLTSTTKRIVPVVQVDQNLVGDGKPGPVSQALLQDLIRLEEKDRQVDYSQA